MADIEKTEPDPFDAIVDAPFDSALSERYLVYALSTITARSLPDLRDGLKPVHRRLLWAMRQLKLNPTDAFKKSARVVGDVIGKYHPHGDQSVYDAMVRLAQDFSLRYPLVEGQGNFGNIDGDNAAAYRYTEARLTRTALRLMEGLDEGTVDFIPTYNGEEEEPEIFPGLFPNLLANGASGIAVGMATNIPSHNVAEIIDATLELIDNPHVEHARLMELFHGPDFATGGLVVDSAASIAAAYETGRGSFRLRGRFHAAESGTQADREAGIERLGSGQWQLVVSEIPYQVQKGKLIEQIAQLIADKKLPILEDVRDESDEAIRLVLVPRSRNIDPELLKESLYKLTDLEVRFGLNLNVLDAQPGPDGETRRTPMVMGLKELLTHWTASQIDILQRRSRHRLEQIARRLELVEGYIIAFLNLDRIIANHPHRGRAQAGDDGRVRPDRPAGRGDPQHAAAIAPQAGGDGAAQRARRVAQGAGCAQPAAGQPRAPADAPEARSDRAAPRLCRGYPARPPPHHHRRGCARGGIQHGRDDREGAGDGDPVAARLDPRRARASAARSGLEVQGGRRSGLRAPCADHRQAAARRCRRALLHAGRGQVARRARLRRAGPQHARCGCRGSGIVALVVHKPGQRLLLAADTGRGFAANTDELLAETRKGRQVVNLKDKARLAVVHPIAAGHDHVAVVGDNRKLVVFNLEELPELARGQGVTLQRYRDGGLSDATTFILAEGLSWAMGGGSGRTRTETEMWQWKVARGGAGRMPPNGFPRDNRFGSNPSIPSPRA